MKQEHPASIFNNIRHHLFSMYHQSGITAAENLLYSYFLQKSLDRKCYSGLKAELTFYDKYKEEYSLTVAGDTGDHVDFSGIVDGQVTRFDVTTKDGWKFKNFSDYERFMPSLSSPLGFQYRIPVFDGSKFIIRNACELAFEQCHFCNGCMIPIVILGEEETDRYGGRTFMNEQYELLVCNLCGNTLTPRQVLHSGYLRPERDICEEIEMQFIDSQYERNDYRNELITRISAQYASIYRGLREELSGNLMAIATQDCHQCGYKNQDSYWALTFQFLHPMIRDMMPLEIQIGDPIIPY